MKIFHNPASWFRKNIHEQKDRSFDEIIRLMFAVNAASGESVTPANCMRCTTVAAIVRALTNAIGAYPVGVFRELKDGDGKITLEPLPSHNVLRLLKIPNKALTQTQYARRTINHMSRWGNHYSLKAQGQTGPIQFLRPLHPDSVQVLDESVLEPVYRVTLKDGQRTVGMRKMLHITGGIEDDGFTGSSPVESAREAIGLCLAAERLLAELYSNANIPGLMLTGGKFTSPEQYDTWINKFKEAYGRGADRGGTAMLPENMDVKEIAFKPVDAQLIEARKFQRTEIASVWGVPPHKLADLERATFSNIEHQGLEFVQDVMLPYVKLIEQGQERDLLTMEDRRAGVVIRYDVEGSERADFKTRTEGYSKMHAVGAINPNEIRRREGLNPRTDPGGEEYSVAMNMSTGGSGNEDTTGGAAEDNADPTAGADGDD